MLTLLTSRTAELAATTTVPAATIATVGFELNIALAGQSGSMNSSGRYVSRYTIKASALTPRTTMPMARARTVSARRALSTTRKRRAEREEVDERTVSASKSEAETWVLRLVDMMVARGVIYTRTLAWVFWREWTGYQTPRETGIRRDKETMED